MSHYVHIDKEPGLTMNEAVVEEINNCHGQHYWKATSQIGSLFGQPVEGELVGIGKTREIALARLAEERAKLYDSLWQ
jgi:hypothetical protein